MTRIGRFLRAILLDGLPQIIDVLRGVMGLVGPQPHALVHKWQFADSGDELMHRHYVKPGITGLAQVNGARGEAVTVAVMRQRVDLDLDYIRNWSSWFHLKILVPSALRGFVNREP